MNIVSLCFLLQWSKFLELGEGIDTQVVEDKISALKPDQCCSLIYTVCIISYRIPLTLHLADTSDNGSRINI